jgi:hypothetical protein
MTELLEALELWMQARLEEQALPEPISHLATEPFIS